MAAARGRLEVCRLLVESKADVAAMSWCFRPPPSHHVSLTICLAAMATLHSSWPSTTNKPTLLDTSSMCSFNPLFCLWIGSRADVAERQMGFRPPTSHNGSLTSYLAAVAEQHSHCPSAKTKPALLHPCASSARCKEIMCPYAEALLRNKENRYCPVRRCCWGSRGGGGGACKEISPKVGFEYRNLNTVSHRRLL